MRPQHIVLLLIDGLRPAALRAALDQGTLPHFQNLLGEHHEHGWLTSVLAPAPSITFASQASLITGAHPNRHDIPGNQFFDRFGVHSNGKARHYAFDVGDTLEIDDALAVFTKGLASRCLGARTLYERAASRGQHAVVVGHMYANGADRWLPPKVDMLARLTKMPGPLKVSPAEFDQHILDMAIAEIHTHGLPDILTVYFMGLDAYSHTHGPQAQGEYIQQTLDSLLGELQEAVEAAAPKGQPPLWVLASDHGQRAVPEDEHHAIGLKDLGGIFQAAGLDLLDHPEEGRHSEAVAALNGGMAMVYLRKPGRPWREPPDFRQSVLPLAQRFWESHRGGALEGALEGVLVRDVAREGWHAPYVALTPDGEFLSLEAWFQAFPRDRVADPVHRIHNMTSPLSGDIILLANTEEGYYFGHTLRGVHGSLHPSASEACLALAWPKADRGAWVQARDRFEEAITLRCRTEDNREPQTADLLTGLEAILLG
ncbi:MAG: alkaline phosphatase family protein [Chloroflexi bacterium]|nr:alkaline phosphatase family protein [Chloroflexota bacterium]